MKCGTRLKRPVKSKGNGDMNRAEQAGRRLGESINEMAHLMYNKNTKQNFFRGLVDVLGKDSICHTCYQKTSCILYRIRDHCVNYQSEEKTI